MNNLYHLPNGSCALCEPCQMAIVQSNILLEIGDKINMINVFTGDPRLKFLEILYGSKDPYEWAVPIATLEKPRLTKFFKNTIKTMGSRVMLHGIFSERHYSGLIENFLSKF